MAFTACITQQCKQDWLNGVHASGDTYKIALCLQATATDWNKTLTTYASTHELATAGNYTQGGATLAGFSVALFTDTACLTFTNPSWAAASFTADGCMIYNSSKSNKVLAILSFGSTTATAGTFTVAFPAASTTGLITIA